MSMLKNNEQNEEEIKIRPWNDEDKQLLIELYPTHSNKELCKILQKTDGQLRGMKARLGLNAKWKPFTDKEKYLIEQFYKSNPNVMDLESFANSIGRQKTSISRYAGKLGLTVCNRSLSEDSIHKMKEGINRYMESDYYKKEIKHRQQELLSYYLLNDHPRGMLGKHHSKETRDKLSKSHIELFANMSKEEKHNRAMKSVRTRRENGVIGTTENAYSRCKGGVRPDLGQYFRSSWEANIARILDYENIEWKYEPKRFFFDEEINGIASYQPDFYLPQFNKWIEVKGWMDDKSKLRLKLFAEQYPEENKNLILIDQDFYNALRLEFFFLPYWEDYAKSIRKSRKDYHDILNKKDTNVAVLKEGRIQEEIINLECCKYKKDKKAS